MSLPVNHRHVDVAEIVKKKEMGETLVSLDEAMTSSTSNSVSDSSCYLFPYEVYHVTAEASIPRRKSSVSTPTKTSEGKRKSQRTPSPSAGARTRSGSRSVSPASRKKSSPEPPSDCSEDEDVLKDKDVPSNQTISSPYVGNFEYKK